MFLDSDAAVTDQTLVETGQLYLTWCHNQPIALFREENFLDSLKSRDREVLLAVKSLSLRFPPGTLTPQKRERLQVMAKASRRLVMDRIADGHVRLSTLQTLCLLSQLDFVDGNVVQAGLNLSMATHLVHSIPPRTSLGDVTECNYCTQGIMTLQNIHGSLTSLSAPPHVAIPSQSQRTSPMLASRVTGQQAQDSTLPNELAQKNQPGSVIVAYAAELTDAWRMARAYAASYVSSDAPPPWNPDSDYSSVMLRHLEVDCKVPLKYRFAANDFAGHDIETLQSQRSYWGPWLFLQIMYAAIPCLLNHPFLLSMRLRNFRYTMPQSFIQQSFDQITRHAGWIIYFLDQLEKKDFQASDPVLAHCVAIVATIHLQHSFVKEYTLRDKAQAGFETCMRFLQRMGSVWPSVSLMAQNLRKLQESIVFVPSPRPESAENEDNQESWSIDAQLLWDILIYEKAGCEGAARDCSIFEDALTAGPENRRQDVAEFDLVGSAGIFGHKTAPKEVPVYAPDEDTSPTQRSNTRATRALTETAGFNEDRAYERFVGLNEQDALFLQPNDFGRAIDNWFNFDLV
ncbi:putative Zn(II)2Cys6 transcription factor [Ilyonectria robusta]|uniref:putative Zn(II)2Cys6 transcription factor n=1 Tax=Ilyonectria robusta TaxID=1079257 RepID=UPI001E8EEE92|nr:putative Zn(II)2Cys6 transcription factor [Ilyonectria robusta]KAH8686431.1 putative Zn(II)2Cys6 transcription factor [Ilyonectria robusta]